MMRDLFHGWGTVRWIRLALAGALLMAGITSGDTVAYAAAAFFGLQAVLNFGCCAAACRNGTEATNDPLGTDVVYEEIK